MKKLFLILFLLPILISCTKTKTEETAKTVDTLSIKEAIPVETERLSETDAVVNFKNDFDILRATTFRDWENKNPANSLTKNWIDLYEKNGKYYLAKADFKLKNGFDECSGDSTKTIESSTKTMLFMDFPELKLGEIKSVKIDKNKIWPKEKIAFRFNAVDYFLRGEGDVLSSEKVINDDGSEEVFQKVKNYKLFISTKDSAETLLLQEDSFNDTFVELLFVGDIDRDGKLDFIFGANRDYEEERVILFLSSKADQGRVVKKVAEIAIQFDC